MRYKHIIFDLDDTLIWYNPSETGATRALLERRSIPLDDAMTRRLLELAWTEWDAAGLCDTHIPEVNARFHELYRSFRVSFFDRAKEFLPLDEPSEALGDEFYELLAVQRPLCKNAVEVLDALSKTRTLSLATNGLESVQRSRASLFKNSLTHFFISETLGVTKPDPLFFKKILASLKTDPQECLMVGDSLSMDIAGAQNAGIDGCWIDTRGSLKKSVEPKYTVKDLDGLAELLKEDA